MHLLHTQLINRIKGTFLFPQLCCPWSLDTERYIRWRMRRHELTKTLFAIEHAEQQGRPPGRLK